MIFIQVTFENFFLLVYNTSAIQKKMKFMVATSKKKAKCFAVVPRVSLLSRNLLSFFKN